MKIILLYYHLVLTLNNLDDENYYIKENRTNKKTFIYKIFIQCKRKCNSFSFKYIHKLMEHKI